MRLRPAIADLRPFDPRPLTSDLARRHGVERIAWLASNEGPVGPFPAALAAIAAAAPALNRYPHRGEELRERLAARHGVPRERIALGNGADGIITNLSSALLDPGDEAVMPWPSFVSYRLAALRMGAVAVAAPLAGDGAPDLDALLERIGPRTRIAWVCNPNNPTGGAVGRVALAAFVEAVPEDVLVVLDEAYAEYVELPDHPDGIAEHAAERPNVAVLRTFSKIYGLAGLRIGYMVAAPAVVAAVARMRNAFDANELAHLAAVASLGDEAEVARRRAANREGRAAIEAAFRAAGVEPLAAAANFVCAPVGDGAALAERLERAGVVVRSLEAFGAPGAVRVTVGTPDENAQFAAALAGALEPLPAP